MRTMASATALLAAFLLLPAGCKTVEPRPISVVEADAQGAFEQGDWGTVEAMDSEIIDRTGGWYRSFVRRGVARAYLGNGGGALGDFEAALTERPEAAMPRLYRAELNLAGGNTAAASEDVNAILAAGPAALSAHERIILLYIAGEIAEARGQLLDALRSYRLAIDAGEADPDAWVRKHYRDALYAAASVEYRLGNFAGSLALMERYESSVRRAGSSLSEDDAYTMGVTAYLAADFAKARQYMSQVSEARRQAAGEALDDPGFFAAATR